MSEQGEAYARGRTDARLGDHDEHFKRINGSLETMAVELQTMNLGLQQLTVTLVNRTTRRMQIFATIGIIGTIMGIVSTALAIAK
jgi:Mg2+ and Co2+ transporter CorA